ncbi:MAG: hypothetical protein PHS88_03685 [Candidatus Omnitrophica bacterium]|nr:hypothetical protein [Candidatus Omnitrophota bacterium]
MKTRKILAFILLIAFAMVIHGFVALHWSYSYNSDDAVVGMRSFHLVENGRLEVSYFKGDYYGDLPQIIQAPVLWLTGHNIIVIRIFALFYLLLFFVLHAILTTRLLGARTAAISLMLMSLASLSILRDTTMFYFFLWPALNIAALLCVTSAFRGRFRYLRHFLIGLWLGLGLWCTGQTYLYGLVVVVLLFLGSEEWGRLSANMTGYAGEVFGFSAIATRLIMMSALFFLFLHAFVGNAPELSMARQILFVLMTGMGLALLMISRRRKPLILSGACLALGFCAGMAPRIYDAVFFGIVPMHRGRFTPPLLERLMDFIRNIFPFLFGAPSSWESAWIPRALWLLFAGVMIGCLAMFFWIQRRSLMKFLTLSRIDREDRGAIVFVLLFGVTLAANVCYLFGFLETRHAIVAWPAAAAMVVFSLSRLMQKYRKTGIIITVFLVTLLSLQRCRELQQEVSAWHAAQGNMMTSSNMNPLLEFLSVKNIHVGYAGFWQAYAIDFLAREKFIFVPFEDYDRYPEFLKKVKAGPRVAYLIGPLTGLPYRVSPKLGETSLETLLSYYRRLRKRGVNFRPGFIDHLQRQRIIKRKRAGVFDVWIMTNHR